MTDQTTTGTKICADCGPTVDDGGDADRCLHCWENTQIRAEQRKFLGVKVRTDHTETGTERGFDHRERWAIEFTRANALERELQTIKNGGA